MDIARLSNRYRVKRLTEEDVPAVLSLCEKNTLYYRYCPPFVSEGSITSDMAALPPGKTLTDKHYIGYYDGERLIAVMDLILAYPDEQTAFIGFFMTDAAVQNKGVGSGIIEELCDYLSRIGIQEIRLGWVKGNPQAEHFWHKNGFTETGRTWETERYTVVAARKDLPALMN